MMEKFRLAAVLALGALATGCSTMAPKYTTNYGAVSTLKEAQLTAVKPGNIAKQQDSKRNVDKLSIRGGAYNSPYGSFTRYLMEALKDDLDHANLIDAQSGTQVDGILLRNTLDASGVSIGFAELEAKLVIQRGGTVAYESTKSIRHEWPSSFVGAVAIPRAINNYPLAVRKLLGEFYADPAFIAALKQSGN